ncbi:ASCH domain-containing protein [Enterococcus sp. BWM-S5]|uniref:ASCH domain-containing protein n=1 Tax=Enterococcus larvae TaxID=2794352 RepID=A0ABS4CMA9_9ENTE|nr:ASCH domain-containing protein [Enterococcus larvae]MBP1047246.1 ASCH domain-containing protein [Enterococcus larvae]
MNNPSVEKLWNEFIKSHDIVGGHYTAWGFGRTPEMADELLQEVLHGEKRGTSGLKRAYELEHEELPKAGDYSVLLDGKGEAAAIIEAKLIDILPYKNITDLHGYLEGEGERNLTYWRSVHHPFFEEELNEAGEEFTEDHLVVYEYFEVVYRKK